MTTLNKNKKYDDPSVAKATHYFCNEIVEDKLRKYLWTNCTNIPLRDSIMTHATELIVQIIRKQNLHMIYPGHDDSAFGDLVQTAWCVTPDTIIHTQNGLKAISDIIKEDSEGEISESIYGLHGLDTANYYARRPATKTYKINLANKQSIEVTGEHPIRILTENGPIWQRADNLQIDDLVAVQINQNCFGNVQLDEDFAYLIGLMICNGSIRNDTIYINKCIRFVRDRLINVYGFTNNRSNVCASNDKNLVDKLREISDNFVLPITQRSIPKSILQGTRETVIAFIRGICDNKLRLLERNNLHITISPLLNQFLYLLQNLGFNPSCYNMDSVKSVRICNDEIEEFTKLIKPHNPDLYKEFSSYNDSQDKIDKYSIKRLIDIANNLPTIGLLIFNIYKRNYKKKISFVSLGNVFKHLNVKDEFLQARYSEYINKECIWVPIKSIENGFSPTIALSVEKHQTFTANGIITHNCQIERTLYKFRAKPHCRCCYNPDRPNNSALYIPADFEYGIVDFDELFNKHHDESRRGIYKIDGHRCPYCKSELSDEEIIEAEQGIFGGSKTVLFRGNSKVFNMWSQVSRTVILAFVKREGRDKKNSKSYKEHICNKSNHMDDRIIRFMSEAEEMFCYDANYISCLEALKDIIENDDRPYEALVNKITNKSNLHRSIVTSFLKMIKLRGKEFTDSPINKMANKKLKMRSGESEEDEDDFD